MRCPRCGYVPENIDWSISDWVVSTKYGDVTLAGKQQVELFCILQSNNRGLTRNRIVDLMYGQRIDGGVSWEAIGVAVSRLRVKLAPIGVTIAFGNNQGTGYSMKLVTPQEADKIVQKYKREHAFRKQFKLKI